MNLKSLYFIFLIGNCSFMVDYGTDFEDNFKMFDASTWRNDVGARHCGSQSPVGCVWTKKENLRYITHNSKQSEHWKASELRISLRNDCEGDFCCSSGAQCTSYTSGQVTSRQLYGYGSFSFRMRIAEEVKTFEIKSVSFKSVYCAQSPSSDVFPAILRKPSTSGYCEVENADLRRFSSNQDLCHSSTVEASKKNICARFSWVIDNFASSSFHFKMNGKNIDYEKTAIYIDDELFIDGGRNLMQDFKIKLELPGMHKVELFGFEDCCAGSHKQGYGGWLLHRSAFVGVADAMTSSDESDNEAPGGPSSASPPLNVGASSSGNIGGSSSGYIENTHSGESNRESTTLDPRSSTTRGWAETTPEATFYSSGSSSDDEPNPGHFRRGFTYPGMPSTSSDNGDLPERSNTADGPVGDCAVQCISLILTTLTPLPPDEAYPVSAEAIPEGCNCSEYDEEGREYVMVVLKNLKEMTYLIREVCQSAFITPRDALTNLQVLKNSMVNLDDTFLNAVRRFMPNVMMEEEILPNNPANVSLLTTIRQIQAMVQDALERTQQCQNENGLLPDEVIQDLLVVYDGLVHVENMLDNIDTPTDGPDAGLAPAPALEIDEDPSRLRRDPLNEQFYTTTEQIITSTSDPGGDMDGPSVDGFDGIGNFLCFHLQRIVNFVGEKIGMCLSNINPRKALLFVGVGEQMYKDVVDLPFNARAKVGRFRIDWFPDNIVWNADDKRIGSVNNRNCPIPDGSMHMKFYGAPGYPNQTPQELLIEETLQLFSVRYQRFPKDELRLVVDSQKWRHAYLLIGATILFCALILRCRMKPGIPVGYKVLSEKDEMI